MKINIIIIKNLIISKMKPKVVYFVIVRFFWSKKKGKNFIIIIILIEYGTHKHTQTFILFIFFEMVVFIQIKFWNIALLLFDESLLSK